MRPLFVLLIVGIVTLLAACSGGPAPVTDLVITSPKTNAQVVTGTAIEVKGSVVAGAQVSVAIGAAAPVKATLLAAVNGRQEWSAQLTAPAIGDHIISVTANGPDIGSVTATVTVKVTQVQPYGGWQGLFTMDRSAVGQPNTQGTMIVWYSHKWFRLYFGGTTVEVNGVTEGWDLIDNDGFRMVGTYHAAGEKDDNGTVRDEPWIDYYGMLPSGIFIEGRVEPE